MGASTWLHFGSYREDLTEAFELLCHQVFQTGTYYHLWLPPDEERKKVAEAVDAAIAWNGLDFVLRMAIVYTEAGDIAFIPTSREDVINLRVRSQPESPATIDALLTYNRLNGTHSVLDYYPAFCESDTPLLWPFSKEALHHLFGTDKPTRAMVEAREPAIWDFVLSRAGSQEGNYIVVYQDDLPHEIFVMGISGD